MKKYIMFVLLLGLIVFLASCRSHTVSSAAQFGYDGKVIRYGMTREEVNNSLGEGMYLSNRFIEPNPISDSTTLNGTEFFDDQKVKLIYRDEKLCYFEFDLLDYVRVPFEFDPIYDGYSGSDAQSFVSLTYLDLVMEDGKNSILQTIPEASLCYDPRIHVERNLSEIFSCFAVYYDSKFNVIGEIDGNEESVAYVTYIRFWNEELLRISFLDAETAKEFYGNDVFERTQILPED